MINQETQSKTTAEWPLTLAQAAHIARLPKHIGTDAEIAQEYDVSIELIRSIRAGDGYKGKSLW